MKSKRVVLLSLLSLCLIVFSSALGFAAENSKPEPLVIQEQGSFAVGGTVIQTSFFDRLFYSVGFGSLKLKFGASVVSCRRGGASAAFDQLNKYFTIAQMPVVSSCYWNQIHGFTPEDVYKDEEGVRTLRVLANNMAYLIKCKKAANIAEPEEPPAAMTHFVR
jgi:hypothetical protein